MSNDLQNKLKKLQELSHNDKDVIDSLQKKLALVKGELEATMQKYGAL